MRTLSLTLGEPLHWQNYYDPTHGVGVVFCPLHDPPPVGDQVSVKINFIKGPTFFVQGLVVWRRPGDRATGRLRPGAGVQLNQSEEGKVRYIHGFSRGGLLDKRAAARLPIRLQVRYRAPDGKRINFTRDITENGLLISAARLVPVHSVVSLTLVAPPGMPPCKLAGRVVRHVEDERGQAMAIQLDLRDELTRMSYTRLVRDLEKAFLGGSLADSFIAP